MNHKLGFHKLSTPWESTGSWVLRCWQKWRNSNVNLSKIIKKSSARRIWALFLSSQPTFCKNTASDANRPRRPVFAYMTVGPEAKVTVIYCVDQMGDCGELFEFLVLSIFVWWRSIVSGIRQRFHIFIFHASWDHKCRIDRKSMLMLMEIHHNFPFPLSYLLQNIY